MNNTIVILFQVLSIMVFVHELDAINRRASGGVFNWKQQVVRFLLGLLILMTFHHMVYRMI